MDHSHNVSVSKWSGSSNELRITFSWCNWAGATNQSEVLYEWDMECVQGHQLCSTRYWRSRQVDSKLINCFSLFKNYYMLPSFIYHRLILSTLSVGAMLWSMAQLRTGLLRMVVYVVGSCWWCGQLSVLARHTHMPHCPPVPTSSWMLCTDWPQFAVCLESSGVFDSDLLPWRLLLGSICGDVLGWVRMLHTHDSMLPLSMHPSTGSQGWHLASPEPPCYKVYWTWVCMEALHSLWCRVGCASRVSLLSVPRRGWLLSALGRQGLSLLRQE